MEIGKEAEIDSITGAQKEFSYELRRIENASDSSSANLQVLASLIWLEIFFHIPSKKHYPMQEQL